MRFHRQFVNLSFWSSRSSKPAANTSASTALLKVKLRIGWRWNGSGKRLACAAQKKQTQLIPRLREETGIGNSCCTLSSEGKCMPSIAIMSKPQKPELSTILPELAAWLRGHGYQPIFDPISAGYVGAGDSVPRHRMHDRNPELVIVLGGDGTLLAAARAFARCQTPILSVNLGSLGFLAEVPLAQLYPTLEAWRENGCSFDERAMLHTEVRREGLVHREFEALNDVVITKGTIARMVNIVVKMGDNLVAQLRADGVIISTPTGSTAY